MALVKSHSNYVLKSKHQDTSDGTIYERDITTIGGLNQFAKGMTPIYRSNNFIISVRNDNSSTSSYGVSKWEKSPSSGNVWTLQNVSGLTSSSDDSDSTKIVLKQDYYDFCDFAYYGSLSELFRASITDILSRFPGELYVTSENAYYTSSVTEDYETISDRVMLGDDESWHIVSNPFMVNLHDDSADGSPKLGSFNNKGFLNYEIINEDGSTAPITSYSKNISTSKCIGKKFATITINSGIVFQAWCGDNGETIYLSKGNDGKHIRPKKNFIDDFYNECDSFEKLIMNRNSTPLYKSTFSVLKENDYGYYRELESFTFPTSDGGYNIDANDYGFTDYTTRLAQIGEFYDNVVTDNIWRSMTHEAIKNFDWTYTREYNDGDDEEYVLGGRKIQKAIRLIGREFDEIKAYADNLRHLGDVSYNERGNMPDYFLKSAIDNDGWDVKLPYPYVGNVNSSGDCSFTIVSQDGSFTPYSIDASYDDYDINGFFLYKSATPSGLGNTHKKYNSLYSSTTLSFISANGKGATWYKDGIRNRIKPYSSKSNTTYHEMSNEFLRRLKLNSRHIWRRKGSVDGIESILGMFGLKSKRFDKTDYDYEIIEYSWFTNPIEDKWDCMHNMYRIDWVNSTKNIMYDYKGISNYSDSSAASDYVSYQGLPIAYVDDGEKRYLYPNFSKSEKYDGDIYYQMNGGWMTKKVDGKYFQFDESASKIVSSTEPIHGETIKSIKTVQSIQDLLSIPSSSIMNGSIVFVTSILNDLLVINDTVHRIFTNQLGKRYIKLTKSDDLISVSSDKYFDEDLTIYDANFNENRLYLPSIENGTTVYAYIKDGNSFMCKSDNDGAFSVSDMVTFISPNDKVYSNYFIIGDAQFSHSMMNNTNDGWKRIKHTDEAYKRISTIKSYMNGNNPHNGNMVYDNGYEYFKYFNQLFKYSCENFLFDERCYDNLDYSIDNEISSYGFSGLTNDKYTSNLIADEKIRFFGNYISENDGTMVKYSKLTDSIGIDAYPYPKSNDKVSNQVINTKRINIRFKLKGDDSWKWSQIKYFDEVVIPYMEQLIPSTAIISVEYFK